MCGREHIPTRVLLPFVQEAEDAGEVRQLHAKLGTLVEQVLSGRDAALASHRAVLDYADSSIARVRNLPGCTRVGTSSSMCRPQ